MLQNVVGRVLASLSDLDSSTWAKIIYIEKERQLAKVYLDTRAVIIDGSHAAFDGDRYVEWTWNRGENSFH